MSEFLKWFEAQHGKKPGGSIYDMDLRNQVTAGRHAEQLLREREIWEARKQSALYAWSARQPAGKGGSHG